MTQIEITIDGKKVTAENGEMLIAVTDREGVHIPRFCYHKKLSVAANCRMCLVEVENAPKTLPACATPVNDGMKVHTQSKKTLESQRAVMEFLLVNHPLDCPICDQGGQCELQDVSMGFGQDVSRYSEGKRSVTDEDLGPFIETEMTRCIHCTRCVRFGEEVAGVREMGAPGRGEHTHIGTYVKHTVSHELSGNVIDLCPVGALTSKPFRYQARAWEMTQHESIAPHDCVGTNIYVHTLRQEVKRVTPRENEAINETWMTDRDRFSYEGLAQNRLTHPMIKENGQWREVNWQTALNYTADALSKVTAAYGGESVAAFMSPSSTVEEAFLLKKLCQHMGAVTIESRVKQQDVRHGSMAPSLGVSIADIEQQNMILLVGSDIRHQQPLLAHRVRKAALNQAKVFSIHSGAVPMSFPLAGELQVEEAVLVNEVLALAQAVAQEQGANFPAELSTLMNGVKVADDHVAMAKALQAEKSLVLMGTTALHHANASVIFTVLSFIAKATGASFGQLPEGANAVGCHAMGATAQGSLSAYEASSKAIMLHGLEPSVDMVGGDLQHAAIQAADFVVATTAFDNDSLRESCHVLLPMAAFTETSGSFVNIEGLWQSFQGCVQPKGEARPAWKIFRVLGNLLNADGFDFESSEAVMEAARSFAAKQVSAELTATHAVQSGLKAMVTPMYQVDMLSRGASAMQQMQAQLEGVE